MRSASFPTLAIADPRCEVGAVLVLVGAFQQGEWERWIVLALILTGVVLLIVGCRYAFGASRAARFGRDAVGQINTVRHEWWPGCVRYVFRDQHGHNVKGRRYMAREDAKAWRVGDTGTVRYDPNDSARNIWVAETREDVLYEAIGKDRGARTPADNLELARAYMEVGGDRAAARKLLDEVLRDGTEEQKREAQKLLAER